MGSANLPANRLSSGHNSTKTFISLIMSQLLPGGNRDEIRVKIRRSHALPLESLFIHHKCPLLVCVSSVKKCGTKIR